MNILYIGSSADWHVDLWVRYFTNQHSVYLFSDKEDYLQDQPYNKVTIIESSGLIGNILNFLNVKSHKLYQLNKLISVAYYASKVDAVIDKYSIDIVHAHSLYYGFLASYISGNVPVVFTPMGSDVILHAQTSYIYKQMAKKAFARANIVTGDSVLLQRKGFKVGARKKNNYVIQNGVDTSIFYPRENSIKKDYDVKSDEVLVFSPRGITPIYNIDVVVDAFHLLVDNGFNVKLMFSFAFGDEYSQQIKSRITQYNIEDRVIWLGCLSYAEMADHYNAADIIVSVPSSDSSPKSVYEAMFCRKPVIVTDLEWSYELLNGCNCIERVPVRDADRLYLSLVKLIESSSYREELSENAYQEACKYFSYQENMEKMEAIMLNAVDGVIENE